MDAPTIVLPPAQTPPARASLPLLAAIVPVVAGVVLWAVTGSLFALCFAALGPLMLLASFFDGMRTRRRDARRAEKEADAAWQRADAELARAHDEERAARWRQHPDAAAAIIEQPLRGVQAPRADTPIVLGRGSCASAVRASGGDDERARAFRLRAGRLEDAPVVVPLGQGVCVRAPQVIAESVARALVVQLCQRFAPTQLSVQGARLDGWGLGGLPHAVAGRRAAFVLAVGDADGGRADARLHLCAPGEEPPDGITAVLDCTDPLRAQLRTPDGVQQVVAEGLSVAQAMSIATACAARAEEIAEVPARVALSELDRTAGGGFGLPAVIGRGERGDILLDLVDDGPHAIVTGMTGTGKSELLVTWVTAMAAVHGPDRVAFVLADFKGGTAFDPLRQLPQVAAVITDLDEQGARRGVESLTAELRRREAVLADAGVRDIRDHPSLPRLVIVIDEFAALLHDHPDLGAVFTDVAARGRALGMHLILGTQRAAGVIRDALAANCPLRLSLRVVDGADSRLVIGSDAAAEVPGGPESRGLVFVRRPQDAEACAARVALTEAGDLRAAAMRWPEASRPSSPWLPALPARLPLDELVAEHRRSELRRSAGDLVLGRADDPARQSQPLVTLPSASGLAIIGGPGSGKSSALRLLAAQRPDAYLVPSDPEGAWDAVAAVVSGTQRPSLVLCDDLDLLLNTYPPEYAQTFAASWERLVRGTGAVVTLSRLAGPIGRIVEGMPRRALLRMPGKVEHLAAGGEPDSFQRDRPAGRASIDGREVQFGWVAETTGFEATGPRAVASGTPDWRPQRMLSGVVTSSAATSIAALRTWVGDHHVLSLAEFAAGAATGSARVIVVADPEEWRLNWGHLQRIRSDGELLVAAECPSELRQLGGARELPPYARLHAGRAWAIDQGRSARRVILAGS